MFEKTKALTCAVVLTALTGCDNRKPTANEERINDNSPNAAIHEPDRRSGGADIDIDVGGGKGVDVDIETRKNNP